MHYWEVGIAQGQSACIPFWKIFLIETFIYLLHLVFVPTLPSKEIRATLAKQVKRRHKHTCADPGS